MLTELLDLSSGGTMMPRSRSRSIIGVLVVIALAASAGACGFGNPLAGAGNPFVGDWLDPDGHVVPDDDEGEGYVLDSWVVSGHCDWESATFLQIAWPPGRVDSDWDASDVDDGSARLFVRDPDGLFSDQLDGSLETDAERPGSGVASGLHREGWEIWTDPTDETAIYLVGAERTERWPRAQTFIVCL